ncbi:MAG: HAMP domain-containing histidine kinase [Ktedonobacteraceae bacterium]|nr:HAMP domain-containing histidine kinase [Ktedonobacteraceae bacterium]
MNRSHEPHPSQVVRLLHRWSHSPFMGYPVALLLAGGAFLIPWLERASGIEDVFLAPPFVLVTLLVGGTWGVGPALLAFVAELLALDYWIVPPVGNLSFFTWPNIVSFGSFIIIQFVALWVVLRKKHDREQLSMANEAISRHVEELQAITQELELANSCRDLFLAQASHELKTPITSIQGLVQLTVRRLLREPPLPTNYAFLPLQLEKIERQTHRLHTLVDELLSVNYLHSGNVPLRMGPCEVNYLCREVISAFDPWTDHEIVLHGSADQLVIQADEDRLSQVVFHLISNALKYSPTSTTVRVEVTGDAEEALLAVHNDGSSLSLEQQEHLFEPFYRGPNLWCSATLGWGLGLTISKHLVEQQGGRIWVESSEQQGTTFFVALPSL